MPRPPRPRGARASPARVGSAEPPAARLPGRARHNSAPLRAELRGQPQRAEPAPGAGELLLLLFPECHERSCVWVGCVPPGEGVASRWQSIPGVYEPHAMALLCGLSAVTVLSFSVLLVSWCVFPTWHGPVSPVGARPAG